MRSGTQSVGSTCLSRTGNTRPAPAESRLIRTATLPPEGRAAGKTAPGFQATQGAAPDAAPCCLKACRSRGGRRCPASVGCWCRRRGRARSGPIGIGRGRFRWGRSGSRGFRRRRLDCSRNRIDHAGRPIHAEGDCCQDHGGENKEDQPHACLRIPRLRTPFVIGPGWGSWWEIGHGMSFLSQGTIRPSTANHAECSGAPDRFRQPPEGRDQYDRLHGPQRAATVPSTWALRHRGHSPGKRRSRSGKRDRRHPHPAQKASPGGI